MRRTLVGRLSRTRFGYGFVRVEEEPEDLFIPPFAMGGALHGDRVRAGYLETREIRALMAAEPTRGSQK